MSRADEEERGSRGRGGRGDVDGTVRFLADRMLGRLARLLRLWGFDVRYPSDLDDADLVETATRQGRVVLTADRQLVRRRACSRYVLVEAHDPREQLETVVEELDLEIDRDSLFSRCLACNTSLEQVGRERVRGLVPRYVLAAHHRFGRCPGCHRIYWRGSHVEDLERRLLPGPLAAPDGGDGRPPVGEAEGTPSSRGLESAARTLVAATMIFATAAVLGAASPVTGSSGARAVRTPAEVVAVQEEESRYAERRRELVEGLRAQGIDDEAVLAAIGAVPRHRLVPEAYRPHAYADRPLPIGHGQTISQPFVVALMTELLGVGEGDRVLEIGTGSGYQAAVLAELGCRVNTIEIVPELARTARRRLEELGYESVRVRTGDGYHGWAEEAPFDAIIVTAAPEEVPDPLVEQLRTGGRMVIPVGPRHGGQVLTMLTKEADGELRRRRVLPVRFVPFVRDEPGSSRPE